MNRLLYVPIRRKARHRIATVLPAKAATLWIAVLGILFGLSATHLWAGFLVVSILNLLAFFVVLVWLDTKKQAALSA